MVGARLSSPVPGRHRKRLVEGFELTDVERDALSNRMLTSGTFLAFVAAMTIPVFVWFGGFLVGGWFTFDAAPTNRGAMPSVRFAIVALASLATSGGFVVLIAYFFRTHFRRTRRAIMREMGFPICVACGHNLTGLDDDPAAKRCPECGASIPAMPPSPSPDRRRTSSAK